MISNLKSARQAIEAELSHAKKGIAYYTARVEALESALHQLENVEGNGATAKAPKARAGGMKLRRGRKASAGNGAHRAAANGAARQGRKAVRRGGTDSLPVTGGEFWFSLVSDEPRSAVDISNAAISALGIKPEQKIQIQKLKQRVSPALATLVSTQKIKDSGSGRERRFFKG
jgi:hypothetical protein